MIFLIWFDYRWPLLSLHLAVLGKLFVKLSLHFLGKNNFHFYFNFWTWKKVIFQENATKMLEECLMLILLH